MNVTYLTLTADDAARFWDKVAKGDGCWLWTGAPKSTGYGSFYVRREGKTQALLVHRVAWVLAHGSLPDDGLSITHVCGVPLCVRPDHLEAITPQERALRSDSPQAQRVRHWATGRCERGHDLELPDAIIERRNGKRECRRCVQAADRRRFAARRARLRTDPEYAAKRAARIKLNNAVKLGHVRRGDCEVCGAANAQAHHEDYSRPLDVRWLCSAHHADVHSGTAGGL